MQAITADFIKKYVSSNTLPYAATQTRLCVPIISRMCQKMLHGIRFDNIKVCDNLIIDGHHRYLSALIMNLELGLVPSSSTSATIEMAWDSVEFDEVDWDTPERIADLNRLDAQYNNLEIEFVNRITGA
jgi:hypothetical protein